MIEILGCTVHPTGDPGKRTPPGGYLFYAKVWDNNFIKEFSDVTSTSITIMEHLPVIKKENKAELIIAKPLTTFKNKTVAYLHFSRKLDGYQLFNKFSLFYVFFLIFASILIISILIYTTNRYITKPLAIVKDALKANNKEKAYELDNYTTEFLHIGNLIQSFIQQKKELEIAKEKAEESDRLKSAFLANMSHEIRSPLNGIIGFSELLKDLQTDEKTCRYANYITSRSNDLLRIINDILDFSRIEAHQMEIMNQEFFIHPLFQELEETYSINSERAERGIPVIFQYNADIIINIDRFRLKQIFINLIDNAIKFTEEGSIEVGYSISNGTVEFFVKDTGMGIPEDKVNIIFDRFRQINDSHSRQGGNGLGLAICKGILELMEGKIWVVSEENKGSTFYFSIPINQTQP